MKKLNKILNLFYKFSWEDGPKCQVCGLPDEYADPADPYCYKHCKPKKVKEEEEEENKPKSSNEDWVSKTTLRPSKSYGNAFHYTVAFQNNVQISIFAGSDKPEDWEISEPPEVRSENLNDYESVMVSIMPVIYPPTATNPKFSKFISDLDKFIGDDSLGHYGTHLGRSKFPVSELNTLINKLKNFKP